MNERRAIPVNNCKSCQNRGNIYYANGVVDCLVHGRRESLGYVCSQHVSRKLDDEPSLISSIQHGYMRYTQLPLAK